MRPRQLILHLAAFAVLVGGMFFPGFAEAASVSAYYSLRMHLLTIYDTPTATATISPTITITPTMTESATITITRTITPTPTPSPTLTESPTISATVTESPTATVTPTLTPTATLTLTWTCSATAVESPTATKTPTFTATATYTSTDTPTEYVSPNFTATVTPTETPTATRVVTLTVTKTPAVIAPASTYTPIPTSTPFVEKKTVMAYPNPARGNVNFAYTVSGPVKVQIDIFRLTGERVANIAEHQNGGLGQTLTTCWQAGNVAPGVYLCRIVITDGEGKIVMNQTKKVALVK